MQKRILPWSLKGVSRAAREAAKAAAQRDGVPLGVWLSRVIRGTSIAERGGSPLLDQEARGNSIERAATRLTGNAGEPQHH